MRRERLAAGLAGLIVALAVASPAMAAVSSQTLTATADSTKQSPKTRAGVGFAVTIDTAYAGNLPPDPACTMLSDGCRYYPPANRTTLDFDNDFAFDAGTLPTCDSNKITNQTADTAKTLCPGAQVGQGAAVIKTLTGTTVPAVVTAFNGLPESGSLVILLHIDATGVPTKPVLKGVLGPSPAGGDFGKRLDVTLPPVPGAVIEHFDVTINKLLTRKKNKKKKKPAHYYVSTRCADKDHTWTHQETSYLTTGGTVSDSFSQTCTAKKKKKKKK
jgi:hypothetical protein